MVSIIAACILQHPSTKGYPDIRGQGTGWEVAGLGSFADLQAIGWRDTVTHSLSALTFLLVKRERKRSLLSLGSFDSEMRQNRKHSKKSRRELHVFHANFDTEP